MPLALDLMTRRTVLPEQLTPAQIEHADRVVTLDCPLPPEFAKLIEGKTEAWSMPDTSGKPVDAVREVRELIRVRVQKLLDEIDHAE